MPDIHRHEILLLTEMLEGERKGHALKLFLCVSGFAVFMLLVVATGAALALSLFDPDVIGRMGVASGREDEFTTWGVSILSVFFPLSGACLIAWIGVHDCLNSMNTVIRVGRAMNDNGGGERVFAIVAQRVQCSSNKGSILSVIKSVALG
ncbi:MAG: hypothetical protein H7124_04915 [Phycisphaerales bacterium]|nr:hypothetical protein [Hyphomonadaceae bacterium]